MNKSTTSMEAALSGDVSSVLEAGKVNDSRVLKDLYLEAVLHPFGLTNHGQLGSEEAAWSRHSAGGGGYLLQPVVCTPISFCLIYYTSLTVDRWCVAQRP